MSRRSPSRCTNGVRDRVEISRSRKRAQAVRRRRRRGARWLRAARTPAITSSARVRALLLDEMTDETDNAASAGMPSSDAQLAAATAVETGERLPRRGSSGSSRSGRGTRAGAARSRAHRSGRPRRRPARARWVHHQRRGGRHIAAGNGRIRCQTTSGNRPVRACTAIWNGVPPCGEHHVDRTALEVVASARRSAKPRRAAPTFGRARSGGSAVRPSRRRQAHEQRRRSSCPSASSCRASSSATISAPRRWERVTRCRMRNRDMLPWERGARPSAAPPVGRAPSTRYGSRMGAERAGAVFVLPTLTSGQQGPVAAYVSTAGWASGGGAGRRRGRGSSPLPES